MAYLAKDTRRVIAGKLPIGGGAPVVVQTMTNVPSRDVERTIDQIFEIAEAGGELVRIAVPDMDAAKSVHRIIDKSPIPVAADIHFDERLALEALDGGIHKLRLNPGNLVHKERLPEIAAKASERGVPIRIGVNEGSLSRAILKKHGSPCAAALIESVEDEVREFERIGFRDLVLSVKTFSLPLMLEVNRALSERFPYPLHIGVTEAGVPYSGTIRSAAGIGALLLSGIGDTIRVSLTASPIEEIRAAWEILKATGKRSRGPVVISCPGCGRTGIDICSIAARVNEAVRQMSEPLVIAVMGCAVNGPGEARMADVGIAGGRGEGIIFRKGAVIRKVREDRLFDELMAEIENLGNENND